MNPTSEANGATMQKSGGTVARLSLAVVFATNTLAELI